MMKSSQGSNLKWFFGFFHKDVILFERAENGAKKQLNREEGFIQASQTFPHHGTHKKSLFCTAHCCISTPAMLVIGCDDPRKPPGHLED